MWCGRRRWFWHGSGVVFNSGVFGVVVVIVVIVGQVGVGVRVGFWLFHSKLWVFGYLIRGCGFFGYLIRGRGV